MLIDQPRDGILQVAKFLGNFILEHIYSLVHSTFHNINLLFNYTFTALCYSTKLPTTLLKFRMVYSTGEVDCGCDGWEFEAYFGEAGGAYGGGFGYQERYG